MSREFSPLQLFIVELLLLSLTAQIPEVYYNLIYTTSTNWLIQNIKNLVFDDIIQFLGAN